MIAWGNPESGGGLESDRLEQLVNAPRPKHATSEPREPCGTWISIMFFMDFELDFHMV